MEVLKTVFGEEPMLDLYKKICINRYRRANLIFVHIPRAAGTSIANVTVGKRAGHFTAEEIRSEMGSEEYQSYYKFSAVRNPYDRLVSSYHYAKQGGGTEGGMTPDPVYNSSKFKTFKHFVFDWLTYQDINKLDYVFQPQKQFLYQEEELLVDFVGRIEKMEETESKLSDALGREIIIGKRNKSKRSDNYKKYYTEETYREVERIYNEDIETFGYKF